MSSTVLVPGQLFANIAFAVPPNNPFVRVPAPTTRTRKKIPVNLPQETLFFGDGRLPTRRSHFARTPIPPRLIPPQAPVLPPDVISADVYPPPDSLRVEIPNATIRVSLPGRVSARIVVNYPPLLSLTCFFSVRLGCAEEQVYGRRTGEVWCGGKRYRH